MLHMQGNSMVTSFKCPHCGVEFSVAAVSPAPKKRETSPERLAYMREYMRQYRREKKLDALIDRATGKPE